MKNLPCSLPLNLRLPICEALLRTSRASFKLGAFTAGRISYACVRRWIGICAT